MTAKSKQENGKRKNKSTKVMAVASAGGHWVQLLRLRKAWDDCDLLYVTTNDGYRTRIFSDAETRRQKKPSYIVVTDANRLQKFRLIRQVIEVLFAVLKFRPDVVISTGAAPGFFALKFGKLLGARTIWIDSIANAETLSLSGKKIEGSADLWVTQWRHLAEENKKAQNLKYIGSVI